MNEFHLSINYLKEFEFESNINNIWSNFSYILIEHQITKSSFFKKQDDLDKNEK